MGMVIMKSILTKFIAIIEYVFFRISKRYDDMWAGGLFMGFLFWGFVMEPILYFYNVPITPSLEAGAGMLPSVLGAILSNKQKKRYERLCERYKYEEIENPYYELYGLLIWGLIAGSFLLGVYIMQMRPLLPLNRSLS